MKKKVREPAKRNIKFILLKKKLTIKLHEEGAFFHFSHTFSQFQERK